MAARSRAGHGSSISTSHGRGDDVSIADEISATLQQTHSGIRSTPNKFLKENISHGSAENQESAQCAHRPVPRGCVGPKIKTTIVFSKNCQSNETDTVVAISNIKEGNAAANVQAADDSNDDAFFCSETAPLLGNGCAEKSHTDAEVVPSWSGQSSWRMFVVFVIGLFVAVSNKITEPVAAQYVYQFYTIQVYGNDSVSITKEPCVNTTGRNTTATQNDQLRDLVQDRTADVIMVLETVSNILGAISCVFLGSYSDLLGRRWCLLIPALSLLAKDALLTATVYWQLGLPILYAAFALYGLGGGLGGMLMGCYVYSADVTVTESQRTLGLGLVMSGLGLGVFVAQSSAGIFIQNTGFFYPSLTSCLIDLVTFLVALCVLPETVARDRRQWLTPWQSLKRIAATFWSSDAPHQRSLLLLQLLAFFISVTSEYPASKIDPLYLMDGPFCWSSSQIGMVGSVKNGATRITSVILLLLLQRCMSSNSLHIVGALSYLATNVITGLAYNDLWMYLGAAASIACAIMYAANRSIMSRMVPPHSQGALFGGIAVVECMCFALGQLIFLNVYKAVVGFNPGIAYFAMASGFGLVIIVSLVYRCLLGWSMLIAVPPSSCQSEIVVSAANDDDEDALIKPVER